MPIELAVPIILVVLAAGFSLWLFDRAKKEERRTNKKWLARLHSLANTQDPESLLPILEALDQTRSALEGRVVEWVLEHKGSILPTMERLTWEYGTIRDDRLRRSLLNRVSQEIDAGAKPADHWLELLFVDPSYFADRHWLVEEFLRGSPVSRSLEFLQRLAGSGEACERLRSTVRHDWLNVDRALNAAYALICTAIWTDGMVDPPGGCGRNRACILMGESEIRGLARAILHAKPEHLAVIKEIAYVAASREGFTPAVGATLVRQAGKLKGKLPVGAVAKLTEWRNGCEPTDYATRSLLEAIIAPLQAELARA